MIFADTNVLLDLVEPSRFTDWSQRVLGAAAGSLVTSLVVFAELSPGFAAAANVTTFLAELGCGVRPLTPGAAFMAGRAHRAYRRAGGERQAILADFLIGGHASELGATLVTRDRQRFASYFPNLTLITPETHPHG